MNNRPATMLLLPAVTLMLAACGQKGPLYLPDTTRGEVVTRPAPAPVPADAPKPPTTPEGPAPESSDPGAKDRKNGVTPQTR